MKKRNTAQKKAILGSLVNRCDHPSATRLYEDLKEDHPHLSKATVYRVLKNAAEDGEILRLHVGTEDHFDGDIRDHLHIICTSCGAIFDAPLPAVTLPMIEEGFSVSSVKMECHGICSKCSSAS